VGTESLEDVIPHYPGDTSCNTGGPCVSGRRRPGLERPTGLRLTSAPTYASFRILRWRLICFPGLSDTDNMRHIHIDFV